MFSSLNPPAARVLSRPKVGGGGRHYGAELWDGSVIHLTPTGIEKVTREVFSCRHEPVVEHIVDASSFVPVMDRVQTALHQPQAYRFLEWNCEHFANWIAGRPAKSDQINGVIVVGIVLAVIAVLQR